MSVDVCVADNLHAGSQALENHHFAVVNFTWGHGQRQQLGLIG